MTLVASTSRPSAQGARRVYVRPQAGPQEEFLACAADVAIYGGAAGGGKTWGLMLDPLRYAAGREAVSGFMAVIFRRTAPQIKAPGGLWDKSFEVYPQAGGVPNATFFSWDWPRHRTRIRFAHMQYDTDMYDWQGSELAWIGFDELTHFSASVFFYMLSRNRSMSGVRPQMRATVNPDADSWVKTFLAPWVDDEHPWRAEPGQVLRFYRENDATYWLRPTDRLPRGIEARRVKTATFIPARLSDNPALLRANPDYYANLMALPLVERERLLGGENAWKIRPSGNKFKRHWFELVDVAPARMENVVRHWDLAATEPKPGKDPDYTVGVKMGVHRGVYYVLDVVRDRLSPRGVEQLILQTARLDGDTVAIYMEQEPGASGKRVISDYRELLGDYDFHGMPPTGSKEIRANPFSAQAEGGNVKVVRAHWNEAYLNELSAFPSPDVHDDQVDGSSGAYHDLRRGYIPVAGASNDGSVTYDVDSDIEDDESAQQGQRSAAAHAAYRAALALSAGQLPPLDAPQDATDAEADVPDAREAQAANLARTLSLLDQLRGFGT